MEFSSVWDLLVRGVKALETIAAESVKQSALMEKTLAGVAAPAPELKEAPATEKKTAGRPRGENKKEAAAPPPATEGLTPAVPAKPVDAPTETVKSPAADKPTEISDDALRGYIQASMQNKAHGHAGRTKEDIRAHVAEAFAYAEEGRPTKIKQSDRAAFVKWLEG